MVQLKKHSGPCSPGILSKMYKGSRGPKKTLSSKKDIKAKTNIHNPITLTHYFLFLVLSFQNLSVYIHVFQSCNSDIILSNVLLYSFNRIINSPIFLHSFHNYFAHFTVLLDHNSWAFRLFSLLFLASLF